VTPLLADKLTSYVRSGGTLVLSYRSGVKDEHNVVTDRTLPGPLRDLAGVAIHDYDPHTNQAQEVVLSEAPGTMGDGTAAQAREDRDVSGGAVVRFPATVWFDILDPGTARTLGTYGKGYYAGKAAVTENSFDRGRVIYVGTQSTSPLFYSRLLARAIHEAQVAVGPRLPDGVEVAVREKAGTKILFLLNYTDRPQTVLFDRRYHNALTGASERQGVEVPPFDLKVLTSQ
jgi:beta-galactosidase